MAALVRITPDVRAVLAAHVPLQLMDRRGLLAVPSRFQGQLVADGIAPPCESTRRLRPLVTRGFPLCAGAKRHHGR